MMSGRFPIAGLNNELETGDGKRQINAWGRNKEDNMKICDIVHLMRPWQRLKISGEKQVDTDGNHIWTDNLSDAQKLAYWNLEVLQQEIDQETMTIYCIVKEGK